MPHRLFIVARGHEHLYEDLQRQFSGNPEVQVLVDRRHTERRQSTGPHDPDRRRADRRNQGPRGGHVLSAGAVPGLPVLIVELAQPMPAR